MNQKNSTRPPTNTVTAMGELHFSGNVIPEAWYHYLTKPIRQSKTNIVCERPYLEAIIILAEICYWYRPKITRDETSGKIVAVERRFAHDKLQRNYQAFADKFGMGKDQARNALLWLSEKGLITLEFRTLVISDVVVSNVMFVEPVVNALAHINQPVACDMDDADDQLIAICSSTDRGVVDQQIGRLSPTDTNTETTTENITVKQTASQFVAAKSAPSEPVQAAVSEREPTEQQAMFEAVATVCHKDGKLKSVAARIGKCASELVKAGYLPQQILDFEKWWLGDRWRATNTPIPTYAQLLDSIAVSVAAAAAEEQHNKAPTRPDPPMQARARELRKKMVQNGQLIAEV